MSGWEEHEKVDGQETENMDAIDSKFEPIDISGDGGIMKTILREGSGDETPAVGDTVNVHYVGKLLNGTEFDSSRSRNEPFSFKLGQGQVINGWDQGVATMKKGERALLKCRADYAYGETGSPPKIPANATLNFDVELLSWSNGEDFSGDGGAIGKRVKEGSGWRNPKDGEECCVSLKGIAANKEVFLDEKEIWGAVGSGAFPPAVDKALLKMKKGEVQSIVAQPQYAYGEAGLPPHVEPNTPVEFEVELHSWKEVTKIGGDGCLKIKLVEGEGYSCPNKFATVTVAIAEGTSNTGAEPKQIALCRGELPEAVEEAIIQMHKGETAQIVVEPSRQDPDVEMVTDTAKTYCVTLSDFKKAKDAWEMKTDEKLSASEECKALGTVLFKAGKFGIALKHYEQAEKLVDSESGFTTDEEKEKRKALLLAAQLNRAACCLRMQQHKQCIDACNKVLMADSQNVKALYRKGCALNGSNSMEEAKEVLQECLQHDPNNVAAKKELAVVVKKIKAQMEKDKKVYAKIFSG